MHFVRYWLPLGIIVLGIALPIVGGADEISMWGCAALVGSGLSVFFLNWLYRIGDEGDEERVREAEARRFLAEHGHWPDEEPPARRR